MNDKEKTASLFLTGCLISLVLAVIAGAYAISHAGQFIEMISSKEDNLLFMFTFFFVQAFFFLSLCVTFLLFYLIARPSRRE